MLRTFLSDLSAVDIHGVRRVIASKHVIVRCFWAALLLGSMFAFFSHLSMLFSLYRQTPISTKITPDAVPFQFPSLYVCSPYLFGSQYPTSTNHHKSFKHVKHTFARLNHFARKTREKFKERGLPFTNKRYNKVILSSMSINFLLSLGVSDKYETIIKAETGGKPIDMTAFQMTSNDKYLMCIKFKNHSSFTSGIKKLALYMYLDIVQRHVSRNIEFILSITYQGKRIEDKSNGLIFFFQEEGYYPGKEASEFVVSTGMHTKMLVSMKSRHFLNSRDHPCRQEPLFVELQSRLNHNVNESYKLDKDLCSSYQWALAFYQKCGCVPLRNPMPAEIAHNTSRCLNVSYWSVDQIVSAFVCTRALRNDSSVKADIERKCLGVEPCNKNVYDVRWSAAFWPTPFLVEYFVNFTVRPAFEMRLKENRSIKPWENIMKSRGQQQINLVRQNVLKVDIKPQKRRSTKVTERWAYPAINFFSGVGGILGLYLGMSVLSFFELLQTFMQMAHLLQKLIVKRFCRGKE